MSVSYWAYRCDAGRGNQPGIGAGKEVPQCNTGSGVWTYVHSYTEEEILDLARSVNPATEPINWATVQWAAGAGILMWAAGIGIGMLINMVRRGRI